MTENINRPGPERQTPTLFEAFLERSGLKTLRVSDYVPGVYIPDGTATIPRGKSLLAYSANLRKGTFCPGEIVDLTQTRRAWMIIRYSSGRELKPQFGFRLRVLRKTAPPLNQTLAVFTRNGKEYALLEPPHETVIATLRPPGKITATPQGDERDSRRRYRPTFQIESQPFGYLACLRIPR